MKFTHLSAWAAAALCLVLPLSTRAQAPTPGFALLGHLQELDVGDLNDPLSAGRMVVDGTPVVLPRNLFITMPGQYLTLTDLFRGRHPGWSGATPGPTGPGPAMPLTTATKPSGLALKDGAGAPRIPIEVDVIGNIVNGEYRAAVVRMSQQGLNAGAGFIRHIDLDKGELLVGPAIPLASSPLPPGTPGARVRINDPHGIYGRRNSAKTGGGAFDERFAVDPGNAPIVASTGFPMCIPRSANDALCPQSNRSLNPDPERARRFTCGAVSAEPTAPATNPLNQPFAPCDPRKPAPLQVGDYINYAGMLTEESPGSGTYFVAAHAIQALAGIYTSPGANPAYVFTEVAIVGTLGDPWPGIDQEETSRFRIVGFTTDPSRRVNVYLVDNNGSERPLTTLQPSGVAQIGRIRVTLPAKANFLPVARDVRIRIDGHPDYTGSGIAQGQYTSPVSEYITPENTRFGRPRLPVGGQFESFCFLSKGGEPLSTLGRNGPAIGPLVPFPESGHPGAQRKADGTQSCP